MGRFINADAFVSTGQGLLGNNMFAYCNNNPVNYCDANGYLLNAILVDGVIAGVVSLINAAVFGATGAECFEAFVSGFAQGVICSTTSGFGFGKIIKYSIILYDVGSAVYECWKAGASSEECVVVALAQLWAALSFDSLETDIFFDLVFGAGITLTASAITEGVKQHQPTFVDVEQNPNKQSTCTPSNSGNGGIGGLVVVCCKA